MAKTPRKKRAKAPAPSGRPRKGETKGVAFRCPPVVLEGVDRRAEREGLSRNDALIKAALDFGDFPDGRPKVMPEAKRTPAAPPPAAAAPPPAASRMDKAAIGRRKGPAIAKAPVPRAAPVEEAV